MTKVRKSYDEGTFAGARGNDDVAPLAAILWLDRTALVYPVSSRFPDRATPAMSFETADLSRTVFGRRLLADEPVAKIKKSQRI